VSMPAARMGDTTAHGGVIVAGEPTVLIGGAPAARLGDMHTCPIPGAPPPPHVGGPIILGSFTVLIGGKPAARVGDMCTCTGPPDSIVMGCTTVLIGTSGGGGGAGMAGAGGKKGEGEEGADAGKSKELADGSGAEDEAETEDHYIDVKFKDKGGKPIMGVGYSIKAPDNATETGTTFGKVKKTGVEPGDYDIELKGIIKAEWSKKKARDGETVKILVETAGIEDGAKAKFEIYERNANSPDQCIETIDNLSVSNDKVEAEWEYFYEEDLPVADNITDDDWEVDEDTSDDRDRGYYAPSYFFVVTVGTCSARSPILEYKDFIELSLCDDDDQPAANALFRVFLSNGEVREGSLDGNGYKKVENVPPGKWRVEFPDYGTVDED
jgi:uncharacterized Zn-binding protein involved in type VI secretion